MTQNLRPITSLLLSVALLLAGNGLQFTLLPLRGHAEGFGTLALGIIASAYYVGFVSGCLLGPYAIMRVGHIRAFAAMVAVAAAVTLAYALVPDPIAWVALRLVTGVSLAGFFLVIESWLNDHATNETRGLVMSAYVAINFAAIVVGQFLVTFYAVEQDGDFMAVGHPVLACDRAGGDDPLGAAGADQHRAVPAAATVSRRRRWPRSQPSWLASPTARSGDWRRSRPPAAASTPARSRCS